MRLASVEDAKLYVKSQRSGSADRVSTEDEQILGILLDAFSEFMVDHTGRKLAPEPALVGDPPADTGTVVTKTFRYPRTGDLRIPDLRVLQAVTLGGMPLTNLDPWFPTFELSQRDGQPATHINLLNAAIGPYVPTNIMTITGRWGFLTPPSYVKHAVLLMTARAFKKRDANYADLVQVGMDGPTLNYYRALPEEIKLMVESLRVPKFAFV